MAQPTNSKKRFTSPIQNIKVVVRVRPLNNEEKERRVKTVVHCISPREIQTKEKKYQFDRVFQPDCTQMDIYSFVVAPMISDVLAGYNCTVFAYGQTGTGKTHTMTGGDPSLSSSVHWKDDELAGCIPRAAANIFDEIGSMEVVEYNVRVSFLELYNEEVRDLLSEDERPPPLNIFNDSKGSVYIQGLNEITVFNSNDIYLLLQQGTRKRQTASTLMNNHSSRSHTVFTITVHTREANLTGEEVLKTGKINLVDLAGSENIAKSGAKDKRAQELANINRSLLTLGRVIQILAEKNNKHVPYRDSKLTRILQDSLGGHTKTCIIATVSPSSTSYEETQSTLEYACRARDIRNTPTVNEKVTKAQMMKEMTHEIEKLKRDLEAARSGDGFFIDRMNWEQLTLDLQNSTNTLTLKNEIIDEMKRKLADLELIRDTKIKEFEEIMNVCQKKEKIIEKAKFLLKEQKIALKQEQYVAQCYAAAASETTLKAKELLETTKKLSSNQEILQKKLENQYFNNYTNEKLIKEHSASLNENLHLALSETENIRNSTYNIISTHKTQVGSIRSSCRDFVDNLNLAWENKTRPLIDSVFIKQSELIRDSTTSFANSVDQSQKENVEMSNLTEHCLTACLSATKNFKSYDENVTSQSAAMRDLLCNIQNRLQRQRTKELGVLEELEKFTDITKSRITEIDFILNQIDDTSKNIWQDSDATSAISQQRTIIEKELVDIKEKGDLIKLSLENQKDTLENYKSSCSDRQQTSLLETEEQKHKVIQAVNDDLTTVRTFSDNITSMLDTLDNNEASIKESVDNLTKIENLLKITNDSMTKDIVEKIIPVKRVGDTPKQNCFNYPKRIGEGAVPRDVLIKRFKEEFSEDIENESFHLNVSTDSCHPLDDSGEKEHENPELLDYDK